MENRYGMPECEALEDVLTWTAMNVRKVMVMVIIMTDSMSLMSRLKTR